MNKAPIKAKYISEAGYDFNHQVFEIALQDGRIYQYYDLPEMIYRAFTISESPNEYYQNYIRGKYAYSRVEGA